MALIDMETCDGVLTINVLDTNLKSLFIGVKNPDVADIAVVGNVVRVSVPSETEVQILSKFNGGDNFSFNTRYYDGYETIETKPSKDLKFSEENIYPEFKPIFEWGK